MKRHTLLWTALTVMATACTQHDINLYQGSDEENDNLVLKDPSTSTYFDFTTTHEVSLQLDLGAWGKNAFVMVYDQNPLLDSEDEAISLKEVALYAAFADENGKLSDTVTLPSGLTSVWVYCPSWALPDVTELSVKDGVIQGTISAATKASTRSSHTSGFEVDALANNFYQLCRTTNGYGAIEDMNGIYDTSSLLTADDLTNVMSFFWNSNTYRNNPDNLKLATESSDRSVTLNEPATVWVTLLADNASYVNTLGYYYYKTDDATIDGTFTDATALQFKKDLKKFIVFPNASIAGSAPFNGQGSSTCSIPNTAKANAPLTFNSRVKLLFQQEDGTFTDQFPAGYTIGFFLRVNGWFPKNGWAKQNAVNTDFTNTELICTNSALNVANTNKQRFIGFESSFSGHSVIVYGVDDMPNGKNYDCVVFYVEATPDSAIHDNARSTLNAEELTGSEKTRYFYAFEDTWPSGGDYDMNDVVIRHDRVVTFGYNNTVKRVEDSFTPIQPSGSASNANQFGIQIPKDQRGNSISIPQGATDETATQSVILFTNTNESYNETRTITRTWTSRFMKTNLKTDVVTDVNPFIIAKNSENTATSRVEVHLPKAAPTAYINKSLYNTTENAFYINANGNFPFAIAIPAQEFTPCAETVRIDKEYPDFTKWVKSEGADYCTWYLNHVK